MHLGSFGGTVRVSEQAKTPHYYSCGCLWSPVRSKCTDAAFLFVLARILSLQTISRAFAVLIRTQLPALVGNGQSRQLLQLAEFDCFFFSRFDHFQSGEVQVQISVKDENDNAPRFSAHTYQVAILENSTRGTWVLRVTAADPDEGSNGHIAYTLQGGDGVFSINRTSGDLCAPAVGGRGGVFGL